MQKIAFRIPEGSPLRVLCLGAHCDDIEIGCGGTILELAKTHPALEIRWVVFGSNPTRAAEAKACSALFLRDVPNRKVEIRGHRDGFFPAEWVQIKEYFEEIKRAFEPDVVFTHYREDRHQDHRVMSDLAWNTFRNHMVLEYEVPKYDGDLGVPNFFVPLSEESSRAKVKYILDSFHSQSTKHWLTEDTLEALMRLRGIESGGASRHAEAFYCRKVLLA
ncbi:MAG TPA: PIG-L deacetylase family protein [Bacteroidota bacterium]|nr:PIG-L deacetylase family protein [Bacteroidota bacterium]